MKIFFLCSHASPDMSLRLVNIQYHSGSGRQRWIDLDQPLGNVLMYSRVYWERFSCIRIL